MKLPNFYNFEPLNALKEKMGIPRETVGDLTVLVDAGRLTELELEKLTSQDGLDISLDDLKVLDDGTLSYKNSRVLLYIRDIAVYGGRETEPRYHLSNCSTLIEMRERKRFSSRYVVSTRVDGRFNLNLIGDGRTKSKLMQLSVCQNCLGYLSFNGFRMDWRRPQRANAVKTFTLEEFFIKYPRSLHAHNPTYNADNAPLNDYTADFALISAKAKAAAKFKCQRCAIDLSSISDRKFLHTHHKNGAKSDNTSNNLEVLCFGCHTDEPAHQHMKRLPEYLAFQRVKARLRLA